MKAATVQPLDYFLHAAGPAAAPTLMLNWVFSAMMVAVCILIGVLLLIAIFRQRPELKTGVLRSKANLKAIAIGTGIVCIILLGLTAYMMVTLEQVATPRRTPALIIIVTGYDWWWKVDYESPVHFTTANEIHIPVGAPVLVKLKSADVIHAFWVPALAGKTEMIPGLANQQWIEADKPGIYRGQCTQFCGVQHAHMGFEVIAESPEKFQAWAEAQKREAAKAMTAALAGEKVFMNNCSGCHTVRGSDASGEHGPDLTHLGTRRMLAAGLMTNTPKHLAAWVDHPQVLKPGVRMPDFALPPEQASVLATYLAGLK